MTTIGINEFARNRHQQNKPYSHYADTEEVLIKLILKNFDFKKDGYRDGVCLVPVPPMGFYTGSTIVTPETELRAIFEARREGEDPFTQILAKGRKATAKRVEIVLYRKDVLDENDEATEGTEWEVVSINARDCAEEEPMPPLTMARNFLELTGGTKGDYSAEQFAKSIVYWSKRAKIDTD